MMRRSTWIVLGIFVLLIGFTLVYQRYQANNPAATPTFATTPTAPPAMLYSLSDTQIKDIKIADNTGSYIDLYQDSNSASWAIEGVPAGQADSTKIKSISTDLLALQVQETLANTVSLAAVGLETPTYTITLTTTLNQALITYVGTPTAIGTGYYVRQNDGQIMIVDKSSLDPILNALKEPPLLPTPTPQVTPGETGSPAPPAGQGTPTP